MAHGGTAESGTAEHTAHYSQYQRDALTDGTPFGPGLLNRADRERETVSSIRQPAIGRVDAPVHGDPAYRAHGGPFFRALDRHVDFDRAAGLVVRQVEAFFDLLERHRVGHDIVEPGVFPGQEIHRDIVIVLPVDDSVAG